MNNEYYGVASTPTSDFLAHYGVRGMKWGVRRAIKSGSRERLSKEYMKAAKRLGVLSMHANNTINKKNYDAWRKQARKSAIAGAVGGVTGTLLGTGMGIAESKVPFSEAIKIPGVQKIAGLGALGFGAAGALGGYTGGRLRASMYKRRMTPKGRAKQIAKREEFRREMENAFKGTAYGGKAQKKFHREITALSDQKDPAAYVYRQYKKANADLQRSYRKRRRG